MNSQRTNYNLGDLSELPQTRIYQEALYQLEAAHPLPQILTESAANLLNLYLTIMFSDNKSLSEETLTQLIGAENNLVARAKDSKIKGDVLRRARRTLVWAFISICHMDRVDPNTTTETFNTKLDWWKVTLEQVRKEWTKVHLKTGQSTSAKRTPVWRPKNPENLKAACEEQLQRFAKHAAGRPYLWSDQFLPAGLAALEALFYNREPNWRGLSAQQIETIRWSLFLSITYNQLMADENHPATQEAWFKNMKKKTQAKDR